MVAWVHGLVIKRRGVQTNSRMVMNMSYSTLDALAPLAATLPPPDDYNPFGGAQRGFLAMLIALVFLLGMTSGAVGIGLLAFAK